jgi:hypothetical protein
MINMRRIVDSSRCGAKATRTFLIPDNMHFEEQC